MASLPPISSVRRASQEETPSVEEQRVDPAFEGPGNLDHLFEGYQYTQGEFQQNETGFGPEGSATNEDQMNHLMDDSTAGSQTTGFHTQPIEVEDHFHGLLDEFLAPSLDASSSMTPQQPWVGNQGGPTSADFSMGNWQSHGFPTYEGSAPQLPQSQNGFDDRLLSRTYQEPGYSSQQGNFAPQYAAVNNQGHVGGHGRHNWRYNGQQEAVMYGQSNGQPQIGTHMSYANRAQYAHPESGREDTNYAPQANGIDQQFSNFRQSFSSGYLPASPLMAPQPKRPLPTFIQNHTGANAVGYTTQDLPENRSGGQQLGSNRPARPTQALVVADGRQHPKNTLHSHGDRQQQAAMASYRDSAPRSYQESLEQARQGLVNMPRPRASNTRPSRESTSESQSVPIQVVIPADCPIGNLTNYSLHFVAPAQKVVKKALDEHWIDYPGPVLEFFSSPFPEYCLPPEDPRKFLPLVIHVKSLSPAQMLEYHARAPQHRDLMHQFVVPRLTGYPNELPGDTPAIKQKKFKNNTISMRQQRMRELHGQFMGDAKISRVSKGDDFKSLTKVFREVLPKTNGARLLHNTTGQILKDPATGDWITRVFFTGGGLSGEHAFKLRKPMAIPQPFADELKKAGLPEPDLHEHLRQNEEIWQIFYPEYFNKGELPPIEKNRRATNFTKGRGRKATVARGTKRRRTAEPATQQGPDMPSSVQPPAMPLPQQQQQQYRFENMQSAGTQHFFGEIEAARNQRQNPGATPAYNSSPQGQHLHVGQHDRAKKRRTSPAGYVAQEHFSMTNTGVASRGSFMQQLNHQQRGTPVARSRSEPRQQQSRAQQHEQVARIVGPGFEDIVGTAFSAERARQAQTGATFGYHNFHQGTQVDVSAQQEQPVVDNEQWTDYSSSPMEPAGGSQVQAVNLGSSSVNERSSPFGRSGLNSSPIRYDLSAMPRFPIGGAQWQAHNSTPLMFQGAGDCRPAVEARHDSSSPPVIGEVYMGSWNEPGGSHVTPGSPKSGFNDSGYFPGGLGQGNDRSSDFLSQKQDHGPGLHHFDLSQVDGYISSYFPEDSSHMPEAQVGQNFEANGSGSGSVSQHQDLEFDHFDLSQVSHFNAYSLGDSADNSSSRARMPEVTNSGLVGNGDDATLEYQSPTESQVGQSVPSHVQVQDQEDVRFASAQHSAIVRAAKEPMFIDLSQDESAPAIPATRPQPNSHPDEPVDLTDDKVSGDGEFEALLQATIDEDEGGDFDALMQAAIDESEDKESEVEAPPRKMSWSELNDHASAHKAQWGDRVFDTCEACQEHREAMGLWGAEKTKKKVKGEAIGYGRMTEQDKSELQNVMLGRGRSRR